MAKQGHWWFNALAPLPLRPLTSAVQDQAAQFLESGGAAIPPIAPAWAPYFEEPPRRSATTSATSDETTLPGRGLGPAPTVSLSTCRSHINCFHGKEIKLEF